MRILVLLPRFPYPLDKGDKLRAYHQIVELAKRHEVHLFALTHQSVDAPQRAAVETHCASLHIERLQAPATWWGVLWALLSGKPLQLGYWTAHRAQRAFRDFYRQVLPDVVYCQMLRTIPTLNINHLKPNTKHLTLNTKFVLDFQDALSLNTRRRMERTRGPLRWLLHYEHRALQRAEQRALGLFDATTVISPIDQAALGPTVRLVPNGVDTDYFSREPVAGSSFSRECNQLPNTSCQLPATSYQLLFTGNMSYAPNVDAACWLVKEIMPLVWERCPYGMHVLIAGAEPKPAVRALVGPRVTVSGRLPDIRTAYAAARIFVAPMRIGSGMQNKLLEAMSMGLPCVTTSIAATPLGATPGEHLLVGDTAEEIADLIVKLTIEEMHRSIADGGHRFVQQHYSWPAAIDPLEAVLIGNGE